MVGAPVFGQRNELQRTCCRLSQHQITPNSISSEKNYNSGGFVTHESGKNALTVHVTVYHDADRPSKLDLPQLETGSPLNLLCRKALLKPNS